MTASELNATLAELGWSQRHLAERIGVDKMLANRWSRDMELMPEQIAEWLRRLRTAHREIGEPEDWWEEVEC